MMSIIHLNGRFPSITTWESMYVIQLEKYTFWQLKRLSNQFANTLRAFGIGAGDRLGILLPQCPETGIAHIAAYKIGGIAIPLFTLFGPDALEYRLANSEAKGVVTDEANLDKVLEIKDRLPQLKQIFVARGEKQAQVVDFWEVLEKASNEFTPVRTRSDDPALLAYTSGTTGPPKGALHPHRMLLGHIPGVEF
jgi:acetyl-CoA synthetase